VERVSRSVVLSWGHAGRDVCLVRCGCEGALMTIDVLALVGVTPERVAALTAAGYAVHEGKHSATPGPTPFARQPRPSRSC
jgi:hypothetical protein